MKYFLLLFCAMLLFAGCSSEDVGETTNHQQAAVQKPADGSSLVLQQRDEGDQLVIDVLAKDIDHLQGAQFNLHFDPSILEYSHAEEGTLLKSDGTQTMFLINAQQQSGIVKDIGIIRISRVDVAGNGLLASVHFQKKGAGQAAFSLSNIIIVNNATQKIAVQTPGISVAVT